MRIAAALAVCAAWGMSSASEQGEKVPVEISAVRSDVIVAGRVDGVAEPEKMRLCVPGSKEAAEGMFLTCRLTVREVLKDTAEEAGRVKGGQAVTFLTPAAKAGGDEKVQAAPKAGTSQVLLLRRLEGREELYLPDVPSCRHQDDPQAVARVREAMRTDLWGWGEAVGGLQVGLAPLPKAFPLTMEVHRRRGLDGTWKVKMVRPPARIEPVVAIRNVSDKPVSVSLHPGDWSLSLQCAGPEGKKVVREVSEAPGESKPFDGDAVATIGPGQVRFLAGGGLVDESVPLSSVLGDGAWAVKAVFTAKRAEAPGPDGTSRKLATGTISSAAAAFQVKTADPNRSMKVVRPESATRKSD